MKLKFENIDKFIKEYYKRFILIDVEIIFINNELLISNDSINFSIKMGESFSLLFTDSLNKNKILKNYSINLINYLNKHVNIPLDIKLGKNKLALNSKSVFIMGTDGDLNNLSSKDKKILKNSEILYTNEEEKLKDFLIKLGIDKKIYNFSEIYFLDFNNINELVLIHYGDGFDENKEVNKVCVFLKNIFNSFYISPTSSSFINKYSLSNGNYGNLLHLGNFNKIKNIAEIVNHHITISKKIVSICGKSSMLSLSTMSINFNNISDFMFFFDNNYINMILKDYAIEIISESETGYFNLINYLSDLDFKLIKSHCFDNLISVFIYPIFSKSFIGYNKFNLNNAQEKLVFLSSPIGSIDEFTKLTITELENISSIFCESKNTFKLYINSINIDNKNIELHNCDDIKDVKKIVSDNSSNIVYIDEFQHISHMYNDFNKKLKSGENIYFITDGGTPCILDPGDNIKKYVKYHYPNYSIIGIKGPNVIATTLLGASFIYKNIYWASLKYTIIPQSDLILKLNYFDKKIFIETLFIFFGFGADIQDDIKTIKKIFEKKSKIQIIGDIGTISEYSLFKKLYELTENDVEYIFKNIKNLVYLIMY